MPHSLLSTLYSWCIHTLKKHLAQQRYNGVKMNGCDVLVNFNDLKLYFQEQLCKNNLFQRAEVVCLLQRGKRRKILLYWLLLCDIVCLNRELN